MAQNNYDHLWENWDKKTPEEKVQAGREYLKGRAKPTEEDSRNWLNLYLLDEELDKWLDDNEPGSITKFKKK